MFSNPQKSKLKVRKPKAGPIPQKPGPTIQMCTYINFQAMGMLDSIRAGFQNPLRLDLAACLIFGHKKLGLGNGRLFLIREIYRGRQLRSYITMVSLIT
jgi:hypothetical protein